MPNSNANLVRSWLLVVAAYMRLRLRGGAKLTPTEMALSIVEQHVPRRLRAAVAGAIPLISTNDFAAAARIIFEERGAFSSQP